MVERLIVFAHYGEASYFIKKMEASKMKDFEGLFLSKNEETLILVCSEEKLSIIMKLCKIFFIHPQLQEVYNLGVCASLEKNPKKTYEIGDVVSVRAIYEYEIEPVFKSYICDERDSSVDLISYYKRLKNSETAKTLSYFAPLLDREAYTIASVVKGCSSAKFYAYKIVSDFADDLTDDSAVCADAGAYSRKLYEYFIEKTEMKEQKLLERPKAGLLERNWSQFLHMTMQQERLLTIYEELLKRNQGIGLDKFFEKKEVKEILEKTVPPKTKTKQVVDLLEKTLNPLDFHFREEMNKIVKFFKKEGVDFEVNVMNHKKSRLSFCIDNKEDLLRRLEIIKRFDMERFERLSKGQIDV